MDDRVAAGGSEVATLSETPRIQLARLVARSALELDDVCGLDPGPIDRYCTWSGTSRIAGVLVTASPSPGTYSATVYLTARMVDLQALAGSVREHISAAAAQQGLAEHLGAVDIVFTAVLTDIEAAA